MPKVINKTKAQNDIELAEKLMKAYAEFSKEKAEKQARMKEELAPIETSMKEAEKELLEIGKRNRKAFDSDKNLVFEHGYLHIADRTEVVKGPEFSWGKFIKKFPDLVNLGFKVAPIKKAFADGDARKPLMAMDIDLKCNEEMEIKVKP